MWFCNKWNATQKCCDSHRYLRGWHIILSVVPSWFLTCLLVISQCNITLYVCSLQFQFVIFWLPTWCLENDSKLQYYILIFWIVEMLSFYQQLLLASLRFFSFILSVLENLFFLFCNTEKTIIKSIKSNTIYV